MPGRVQHNADLELCEHFPSSRVIDRVPFLGYGPACGHHAHARLALGQRLQRRDFLPEPPVFGAVSFRVIGVVVEPGLAVLA